MHTFSVNIELYIPILTVIAVFVRRIARVNSALFSALWTTAPILVSIISFWVYVMRGNELTVSVAFTVRKSFPYRPRSLSVYALGRFPFSPALEARHLCYFRFTPFISSFVY